MRLDPKQGWDTALWEEAVLHTDLPKKGVEPWENPTVPRLNAAELLAGVPQNAGDGRSMTVQPIAPSGFDPPRGHGMATEGHAAQGWRPPDAHDGHRIPPEVRREERHGYLPAPYPQPDNARPPYEHSAYGARGRGVEPPAHRPADAYAPTPEAASSGRGRIEQLSRWFSSSAPMQHGPPPGFDQARRPGEELHTAKLFLGLGPEANRRAGRASPLPQAVQGAQPQPASVGKDPSIKSEFGRMFSGLGSGLGGPGTSTPSRQSPHPQSDTGQGSAEAVDARLQRVSSRNSRRPKRNKDEDGAHDSENTDGRGTPSGPGGRGSKRSKQNATSQTYHHYHHLLHQHVAGAPQYVCRKAGLPIVCSQDQCPDGLCAA